MSLIDSIRSMFVPTTKADASGGGIIAAFRDAQAGNSPRINRDNMDSYLGKFADQAWIYSCIKIIQTKGAGVPLKVYRLNKEGKPEEQVEHPIQKLLESVNPWMNGYDLLEGTHGYIELTGNAYWLLDKVVGGKPTEIYPLNPRCIKVLSDKKKYVTGYAYELTPGVVERTFLPEEILHFKTWNPLDPFYGLAPICAARDSSDMMMFSDQYNKAFFQNGAEPGGFLSTEQGLDEQTATRIRKAWNKLHQGRRKAHKVAILDSGLKFTSSSANHKDMQFDQLKRMTREDVLTVFNMPPIMVGVFDEANYSNAREQRRIFWIDCMIPRLRKIESVINEFLVKPWDAQLYVEHDLSDVEAIAEDEKQRAQADQLNVNAGIMTVNEIRKQKNLPDVPWGNTWYAPMGVSPVSLITEEDNSGDVPPADDADPTQSAEETKAIAKVKAEEPVIDQQVIRRDGVWAKYKGLTERMERKWAPAMRRLFNDQEREVINKVRDADWQKMLNQNKLDKFAKVKQSIDAFLFDKQHARTVFRRDAHVLMKQTIEASAVKEIAEYDLGIDFNISNPSISSWINNKAFKFADDVNTTTEESLRSTLTEAIKGGESLSQVEDRIAEVFDIARGSRTATIARTEVISASNAGAFESYEQSGVVKGTEWITSRDNRVRDEHQIDGEVVDLGDSFSNGLQYPGDPDGEPGNVINCRCTIAPVVNKEAGAKPDATKSNDASAQIVNVHVPKSGRILSVKKEIIRDGEGKIVGMKEVNVYEEEN